MMSSSDQPKTAYDNEKYFPFGLSAPTGHPDFVASSSSTLFSVYKTQDSCCTTSDESKPLDPLGRNIIVPVLFDLRPRFSAPAMKDLIKAFNTGLKKSEQARFIARTLVRRAAYLRSIRSTKALETFDAGTRFFPRDSDVRPERQAITVANDANYVSVAHHRVEPPVLVQFHRDTLNNPVAAASELPPQSTSDASTNYTSPPNPPTASSPATRTSRSAATASSVTAPPQATISTTIAAPPQVTTPDTTPLRLIGLRQRPQPRYTPPPPLQRIRACGCWTSRCCSRRHPTCTPTRSDTAPP